jgi:hypothetical protein
LDLVEQEDALRNAQADEALRDLRAGLRTRTFAHRFKRKNMDGQGAYTKSRELVDGIEDHIHSAATRYRTARVALYSLRGHGPWEQKFQELRQEDIHGMSERVLNDEEKEENRKAWRGCQQMQMGMILMSTASPWSRQFFSTWKRGKGAECCRGFGIRGVSKIRMLRPTARFTKVTMRFHFLCGWLVNSPFCF